MSYIEKLKLKKSQGDLLQKVQKGKITAKEPTSPTAKSAKRPFYSFYSTPGGHISEKKQDIAFDILDRLLGGGRTTTMNIWRKRCREAGVGELDMWRARLEIEQMELGLFEKDGTIKLNKEN